MTLIFCCIDEYGPTGKLRKTEVATVGVYEIDDGVKTLAGPGREFRKSVLAPNEHRIAALTFASYLADTLGLEVVRGETNKP